MLSQRYGVRRESLAIIIFFPVDRQKIRKKRNLISVFRSLHIQIYTHQKKKREKKKKKKKWEIFYKQNIMAKMDAKEASNSNMCSQKKKKPAKKYSKLEKNTRDSKFTPFLLIMVASTRRGFNPRSIHTK